MPSLVVHQVPLGGKTFCAAGLLAIVRLLPRVSPEMSFQVTLFAEAFVANSANVRSLTRVLSDVNLEPRALCVALIAASVSAPKELDLFVAGEVVLQLELAPERFFASLSSAVKFL